MASSNSNVGGYFEGSSSFHSDLFSDGCASTTPSFSLEALLNDDSFAMDSTPCDSPSNNWFLILKNKIINTDKLIQRYQAKNRKVKELQTSLIGFKKDLKALQQKNDQLQSTVGKLKNDLENQRNMKEEQKIYIEQLQARCNELEQCKLDSETFETVKKDKKELMIEKAKLRKENRKLERKLQTFLKEVPKGSTKQYKDNRETITTMESSESLSTKQALINSLQEELNKLGSVIADDSDDDNDEFEDVHVLAEGSTTNENTPPERDIRDVFSSNNDNEGGDIEQRKRRRSDSDSSTENDLVKRACPEKDPQFDDFDLVNDYGCGYHSDNYDDNNTINEDNEELTDCDEMIAEMLDHTHIKQRILTPIPPSPPPSPLPSFNFPSFTLLSPLPMSPLRTIDTPSPTPPPSSTTSMATISLEYILPYNEDNTVHRLNTAPDHVSYDHMSHDQRIHVPVDKSCDQITFIDQSCDHLATNEDDTEHSHVMSCDHLQPISLEHSNQLCDDMMLHDSTSDMTSHHLEEPTTETAHSYDEMSHDIKEPTTETAHSYDQMSHDLEEPITETAHSYDQISHDLEEPITDTAHSYDQMSHDLEEPTTETAHSYDQMSHDLEEPITETTHSYDQISHDLEEPIPENDDVRSATENGCSSDVVSHNLEELVILNNYSSMSHDLSKPATENDHLSDAVSHDLKEPTTKNNHSFDMISHDLEEPATKNGYSSPLDGMSHDLTKTKSGHSSDMMSHDLTKLTTENDCSSDVMSHDLKEPTTASKAQQVSFIDNSPSHQLTIEEPPSPAPLCISDESSHDNEKYNHDAIPFSSFVEATPTSSNTTVSVGYANVNIETTPTTHPLSTIVLSDGEISDNDDIETVGYGDITITPNQATPIKKKIQAEIDLSTDGATGQWVNEVTTPIGSCSPSSSSRSSTPVLAQEFPTVGSQVRQQPPVMVTQTATQPLKFSQSQQSLNDYYQCPKLLPPWLADVLVHFQDKVRLQGKAPAKKKKGKVNCTFKCIQLTLQGTLPLSECISTLSSPANTPNTDSLCSGLIKYINTLYFPPFESVMQLCWNRCSSIVSKSMDPFNPNYVPPLPLEEAIIVAVIVNIQQCHSKLPMLIPELLQKFRECVLSDKYGFHCRCVFSRLYSCLCRLLSDIDQAQFLVCDIFLQSMDVRVLPLAVTAISIWPKAFGRNTSGPPLFIKDSVNTKGLEYQPLSFTLETIMSYLAQTQNDQNLHKGPVSNARILCKWELVPLKTVQSLVNSFIDILKLSPYIKIETPPTSSGNGFPRTTPKPRPSKHAYAIVTALRLLAMSQGWSWTNDTLIRQHLWPILQTWNKESTSMKPETVICVIRLLGFLGKMGLTSDPNSASIKQLIKVFTMVLQKSPPTTNSSDKDMSLPIQLAAADALLDLYQQCPSPDVMTTINMNIRTWTTHLFKDKATTCYGIEYSNVLMSTTSVQANKSITTTNTNTNKKGKRSQRNTKRSNQKKKAKMANKTAVPPPIP